MKLFGNDRVPWISAQLWRGKIIQQHRVSDCLRLQRDRIPEPNVHLQRDSRTIKFGLNVDANSTVSSLFSDDRTLDHNGIKHDAVVHRNLANCAEDGDGRVDVIGTKAQKIDITVGRCGKSYQSVNSSAPLSRKLDAYSEMDSRYNNRSRPKCVSVRLKSCFVASECCFRRARTEAAKFLLMWSRFRDRDA